MTSHDTECTPEKQLILIVHGSRDPRWRQPFEALTRNLQHAFGNHLVQLAYMEIARPSLLELAGNAVRQGIHALDVLPLFMAAGGHVDHDILAQAREAEEAFPPLTIRTLPPIGEHPRIILAMQEIIADIFAPPKHSMDGR